VREPPPLAAYVPGPHGHRPYLSLIDSFVRELAGDDLRAVRRPEIVRDGSRVADFLLGGDLATLPDLLLADDVATIAAEAGTAADRVGAAGLLAPDRESELWDRTFADASVINHGARFHELVIETIAEKILAGGSSSVVAALRRRIWLPLFHPRTIEEACSGALTYRPDRPMHTVEPGGMGTLVQRLLDRIRNSNLVKVIDVPALQSIDGNAGSVTLSYTDGREEVAASAIVGVSPEELFVAAAVGYEPSRVRLAMAWVDVDESAVLESPSVLFVADPDVPVFRISESVADRAPGRRTFTCELHHGLDEPSLGPTAVDALRTLGVLVPSADAHVVRAGAVSAFATPSHDELERFVAARSAFDARELPIDLVGGAAGFLADSFNEQIVQGLLAASRVR
jgi:hypothetical protein